MTLGFELFRTLLVRAGPARFVAAAVCLFGLTASDVVHAGVTRTQNGETTDFAFNALHQRIGATLPNGTRIEYAYGADGNISARSRTPPGGTKGTTHYVVDPTAPLPRIVAEYDDAGHVIATFEYAGDELLIRRKGSLQTFYVGSPNT